MEVYKVTRNEVLFRTKMGGGPTVIDERCSFYVWCQVRRVDRMAFADCRKLDLNIIMYVSTLINLIQIEYRMAYDYLQIIV